MSDGSVLAEPLIPTTAAERISSLDVLRGSALLGIALMNIIFSGLPMAADWNPKVAGGAAGWNLVAFFVQYIVFDGKMRGIFSMMFGAGSYYLITRGERRGAGIKAAEIYYRRTLWLMLFGIAHAYLIWHGDILYAYALLGLVLFPLHSLRPRALLITAAISITVMTGMSIRDGFQLRKTHQLVLDAEKATAANKPLTDEQKEAQKTWEEQRKYFNPTPDDLKKESEQYSGSYLNLLSKRAALVNRWHSFPFYMGGWDMLTMMLIGIAFAKTGVLAAKRSYRFFLWMLVLGYGIGLPINAITAWLSYKQNFEPLQTVFSFSTYQLGRVAVTMGHTALVLLICKADLWRALTSRLAAVGQTAFSNYILHSLIYGFVFYGYGVGLYNKLQRYELYFVVLGMWVVSLVISPIWLRYFAYGPLEWAWRSLTYWKRQPMRLETSPAASDPILALP